MMKRSVTDYADFMSAIRKGKLVYLFGAGISIALNKNSKTWKEWIEDGIKYIQPDELRSEIRSKLNDNNSASNLICIVGNIIQILKNKGKYHEWMRKTFDNNDLTNQELADTLKKYVRAQDVIATTNYDSLLEKATGLESLTYEDTDIAFHMLEEGKSTHVMHLHGMYNFHKNIDNIIADNHQYQKIITDKGAQFIQELLGTRTVIFIGCGQTAEDVNISMFMNFAKKYLRLDCEYYFLCKNGVLNIELSDNIKIIEYGEQYDDLPYFMEEIANVRLREIIAKLPFVSYSSCDMRIGSNSFISRYHFSYTNIPFCGREDEIKKLHDYICDEKKILWWVITGQAGSGKSRLAYEFIKGLPTTWFGFFLEFNTSIEAILEFRPFSNTFVVIDYVQGDEYRTADILHAIVNSVNDTAYKLRVVLLERSASKNSNSWYTILKRQLSRYACFDGTEYSKEVINLGDISDEAIEQFIKNIYILNGIEYSFISAQTLRKLYEEKFEQLKYRPLFVQLFVEACIKNHSIYPGYNNFDTIIEDYLQREQEKWLRLIGDRRVCNALISIIIRANISGKLDLNNLPEYYKNDGEIILEYINNNSFSGKQRREYQKNLIDLICHGNDSENSIITPLYPDIIKEYMFYYYIDKEDLDNITEELWRNSPRDFSRFIERCLTDFPDKDFFKKSLKILGNIEEINLETYAGRLELLQKNEINIQDSPKILIEILNHEYYFWKNIKINKKAANYEEIKILKILAFHLVAKQAGRWSMVPLMLAALDDMLEIDDWDEIKSVFLLEHINSLSMSKFLSEAEYLRRRLQEVTNDTCGDEISVLVAVNSMNSIMMDSLFQNDFNGALAILRCIVAYASVSNIEASRVVALSCRNFEYFASQSKIGYAYNGIGDNEIEKILKYFPNDDVVRARHAECKIYTIQSQYLNEELNETELKRVMGNILSDIEENNDKIIDGKDQSSEIWRVAWSAAKIMLINCFVEDKRELERIIAEADKVLNKNEESTEIVYLKMIATEALYTKALRIAIPEKVIDNLFYYAKINFSSETVVKQYMSILQCSEVSENTEKYFDSKMLGTLLLYSGLMENKTYRRRIPKVGVNEKCPCGSGKKFKKCCRGKGIYD